MEQTYFPFYADVEVIEPTLLPHHMHSYIGLQKKEIIEHKWYLSERQGYDVGMHETCVDWVTEGHAKRFNDDYIRRGPDSIDTILSAIAQYKRIEEIPVEDVHRILGD
jgi:hypothetical protein